MTRTRLSLPILVLILAAAVALIVSVSGGSAKKAEPAVAANSAISVEQTSFGKALADAHGRTLYLFAGDKPNVSRLSAAGRAFWPPLTSATRPSAAGGAAASNVSATAAGQVTYNGHPLYYFVGDHNPGQTAGQGLNEFGARWYVLSPSGTAITSAPKTAPSTSTSSGGGYGY